MPQGHSPHRASLQVIRGISCTGFAYPLLRAGGWIEWYQVL